MKSHEDEVNYFLYKEPDGEFLANEALIPDLECSNLALRPIIRVGISHVRDRIKIQRAMCF